MSGQTDRPPPVTIQAKGLGKDFYDLRAVSAFDLSVAEREVDGLLGPIGSGNSTVVKMLATAVRPTAGTATVCGWDIVDQSEQVRRSIGFVPDFQGHYDDMRVADVLEFYATAAGVEPAQHCRRIDRVAQMVVDVLHLARQGHIAVQGLKGVAMSEHVDRHIHRF